MVSSNLRAPSLSPISLSSVLNPDAAPSSALSNDVAGPSGGLGTTEPGIQGQRALSVSSVGVTPRTRTRAPSLPVTGQISAANDITLVVPRQHQRTGAPLVSLTCPNFSEGSDSLEEIPCAQPRASIATPVSRPPQIGNLELTPLFGDRHSNPRILKNSVLQLLNPFVTSENKFAGKIITHFPF